MKTRTFFLLCVISLCSALSWGQTWNLTSTMRATLSSGTLTVSTTANSEAMPDYDFVNSFPHWYDVRNNVRSVVIGDKITTIGYGAFFDCKNLTSVTISNSVTTIGIYAFGQSGLTSLTLPNSVTTIELGAFYGCENLTSVTIPNSVTTIGLAAFAVCTNLESIQVDAENPAWSSVDGILYNKDRTLLHTYPAGKSGAFTIPATVRIIEENAFENSCLTSVTIPNSVTEIGEMAFADCFSLTSVTIPKSVTAMGDYVFASCTALKTVTVEWATPLTVETIFYGYADKGYPNLSAATLRVPTGTKARYQAASVWKDFGTIVEYSPVGIESVESQTLKAYASNGVLQITGIQSGQSLSIYNLAGQPVYQGIAKAADEYVSLPARGVYIVVAGKQAVKVIMN